MKSARVPHLVVIEAGKWITISQSATSEGLMDFQVSVKPDNDTITVNSDGRPVAHTSAGSGDYGERFTNMSAHRTLTSLTYV